MLKYLYYYCVFPQVIAVPPDSFSPAGVNIPLTLMNSSEYDIKECYEFILKPLYNNNATIYLIYQVDIIMQSTAVTVAIYDTAE